MIDLEDGIREEIIALTGVDQGCPLGSLLFALALRDPMEEVLAFAKSLDPNAALYFYLDDGYIVATGDAIQQILRHLQITFDKVGVQLNISKLQSWSADASVVPEALRPYQVVGIKVLGKVLGAPGDQEHQGLPVDHLLDSEWCLLLWGIHARGLFKERQHGVLDW